MDAPPVNLNTLKLRVFREVVAGESVTGAAQRLFVSQPVVTGHVRALERALGSPLLERRGRRVVPTDAGWALYSYACATLDAATRLTGEIAACRSGKHGQLHIGASPAGMFSIPAFVFPFLRQHPRVEFSLRVGEHADIQKWTASGLLDFAYTARMAIDDALLFEPLEVDETVLVVGRNHPWAETRSVSREELPGASFISLPLGTTRRRWEDGWFEARGLRRHVPLALEQPELIKRAVLNDFGAGLLSRSLVRAELDEGRLIEVRLEDDTWPNVERGFVRRREASLSPLQLSFIEHCYSLGQAARLT